jgi:hypothetical protein
MSPAARLTSIDVIPLLATALQKFRCEAAGAVDDIVNEVRRALEWIHHDRKDYWSHEARRAQDALNQARIALQQAMTMRKVGDRPPSCIDEKRAVEKAKRRVDLTQQKMQAVRHWESTLDRASDDLRRARTQFDTFLDSDVSRAIAVLNDMAESLVAYISMKTPDEAQRETVATVDAQQEPAAQQAGEAPPAQAGSGEA